MNPTQAWTILANHLQTHDQAIAGMEAQLRVQAAKLVELGAEIQHVAAHVLLLDQELQAQAGGRRP